MFKNKHVIQLRKRASILCLVFVFSIFLFTPSHVQAQDIGEFLRDTFQIGAAFLSHMAIHESGHYIMAHMGGAEDVQLDFFTQKGGNLYLGLSTAKGLDRASSLPYRMAGEAAASYLFEVALTSYRTRPTAYNRSLLFFSNTDFLMYTLYALYLDEGRNPSYDPVGISLETGLSAEAILGLAAFQTALNAYRVYSGNDTVVPYITLDKKWAEFGIRITLGS